MTNERLDSIDSSMGDFTEKQKRHSALIAYLCHLAQNLAHMVYFGMMTREEAEEEMNDARDLFKPE